MTTRRKAAAERGAAGKAPTRTLARKAPAKQAPAKRAPARQTAAKRASTPETADEAPGARDEKIVPLQSGTPAPFTETFGKLRRAHPDAHCELDHQNAFQLLVATVLSAQSTDVVVNQVTPALFARWPDAAELAHAEVQDVEQAINRLGMYRQKAKNLVGLARGLVAEHGGEVPRSLDELVALPGVGRKTANVVLGVAFGTPEGVVVDTHVQRITQRLGWTRETAPDKIERDLMQLVPRKHWDLVSHVLIFHGRRICAARKPACVSCPVNGECPSAFRAEQVGRKPPRARNGSTRASATLNDSTRGSTRGRSTRGGSASQAKAVNLPKAGATPATSRPSAKGASAKKPSAGKPGAAASNRAGKTTAPRTAAGSRRAPS